MLSQETVEQIEEILLNPIHAITLDSAKPFTVSPMARSGKLEVGSRLMIPVGETRHRTSSTFLDKGPDEDTPGPEKYKFEIEHTGYWSRISTVTLFMPIEFRGMTPVWMFALSGNFKKSGDIEFDRDLIERVYRHILKSHRQLFQMRRDGDKTHYFRAPEYEKGDLHYKSHWVGTYADFSGSEKVTLDHTSVVWNAHFFGRLIDPIS